MNYKSNVTFAAFTLATAATVVIGCGRNPDNGATPKAGQQPAGTVAPTAVDQKGAVTTADIDVASIIADTTLSAQDKAEAIAKKAELLYSAQAMVEAGEVAQAALKVDAKNFRATLIKSLVEPVVSVRGVLARIAPFAKTNDQLKDRLDQHVAAIKSKVPDTLVDSNMLHFMLDATPDLTKAEDVAQVIEDQAVKLSTVRGLLVANKDLQISLNEADLQTSTMLTRLETACQVGKVADMKYSVSCPKIPLRTKEVAMTPDKFMSFATDLAMIQLSTMIGASYDLDSKIVAKKSTAASLDVDAKAILDEMNASIKPENESTPGFLALKDLGDLTLPALKSLMSKTSTKCGLGSTNLVNRLMSTVTTVLCVAPAAPAAPAAAASTNDAKTSTASLPAATKSNDDSAAASAPAPSDSAPAASDDGGTDETPTLTPAPGAAPAAPATTAAAPKTAAAPATKASAAPAAKAPTAKAAAAKTPPARPATSSASVPVTRPTARK